ncbi:MAG: DNA methyltransferase [Sphingomonadales bacterium 28-64-96]|nr:MAG: DNA methyltransferase [Sphingomonadales bacterium 28-64-96]
MSEPSRPVLRWHGGKWLLAPWIIEHMPPHRIYTEAFGGAASVLLRKPRSYAEVYNDLDGEVVNLFRVLRDPRAGELLRQAVTMTPFSREEFNQAYSPARGRVERARRLIVRSFMGFGSDGACGQYRTGFRPDSNKSGTTPAHDWRNWPEVVPAIVERLRGVVIEQEPAIKLLRRHDRPEALHFIDPPYHPETRARGHVARRGQRVKRYNVEMEHADHVELLNVVQDLAGMVILCGYPHPLYDEALVGWRRVDRAALADGARARTECLWLNPATMAAGHPVLALEGKAA